MDLTVFKRGGFVYIPAFSISTRRPLMGQIIGLHYCEDTPMAHVQLIYGDYQARADDLQRYALADLLPYDFDGELDDLLTRINSGEPGRE